MNEVCALNSHNRNNRTALVEELIFKCKGIWINKRFKSILYTKFIFLKYLHSLTGYFIYFVEIILYYTFLISTVGYSSFRCFLTSISLASSPLNSYLLLYHSSYVIIFINSSFKLIIQLLQSISRFDGHIPQIYHQLKFILTFTSIISSIHRLSNNASLTFSSFFALITFNKNILLQ